MDIEQLRAAVDAAGPREPGRRFSPELRQQLIAATHRLWASGEALADIADALGIHVKTATRASGRVCPQSFLVTLAAPPP